MLIQHATFAYRASNVLRQVGLTEFLELQAIPAFHKGYLIEVGHREAAVTIKAACGQPAVGAEVPLGEC